ncbi:TetR/AcrR family transcriptional regulator [Lactococcus nasutitermitis]|uniref:TetR/AcrR family transcriptional regulator n=1 Tax=Lactococcus nasutitermitis TaxID=1652957 RepID=A0ABV9JAD8_9LACT|nr:TetR/AcrR family transcriptional regulator [Lactococcus nasutitermitis]
MAQRRRGDELKNAIYDATVELLEKEGYEAVTFQNVARKAHTTRSVLYRYWKNTFELTFEAARHKVVQSEKWNGAVIDQSFNTGSLREDLLTTLRYMSGHFTLYPKNFLPYIFFEQSQGKDVLDDAILNITTNNLIIMERILAHAEERGEARSDIGQSAKLLPFQMMRYFIMLGGQNITDEHIVNFVDEVLIPAYRK